MSWYGNWKPYVPVARRRAQAAAFARKLAKKEGRILCPIQCEGRKIAKSFWGLAWCDNLEQYSDFENRLPRGRAYARNGSIIDLDIGPGTVKAIVSGSEIYRVTVTIKTLAKACWSAIKQDCSRSIDSLIDLLQGRFDEGVMRRLTRTDGGLFPQPKEIKMQCTCPDWATLCKHVAATLYGVGARLDAAPELLFTLRAVDHLELVSQAVAAENLDRMLGAGEDSALAGSDLGELFGIEMDAGEPAAKSAGAPDRRRRGRPAAKSRSKPGGKEALKSGGKTTIKTAPAVAAKPPKTARKKTAGKPVARSTKRRTAAPPATGKGRERASPK
ncbi:MAG: hypothetical protein WD847_09780 [Pirellulales bacterium]